MTETNLITIISTVIMLLTGLSTVYVQARKNRNDAAEQLTNGALTLLEPLKNDVKDLRAMLRIKNLYIDYLLKAVEQLSRHIMEQGRKPPVLVVDYDEFIETIDL